MNYRFMVVEQQGTTGNHCTWYEVKCNLWSHCVVFRKLGIGHFTIKSRFSLFVCILNHDQIKQTPNE